MGNLVSFKHDELTADEWVYLRRIAGFPLLNRDTAEQALAFSNTIALMYDKDLAGMLRIIGDGVYSYYFNDVIIAPKYQGKGLGAKLIEEGFSFISKEKSKDKLYSVSIFANEEAVDFYKKKAFSTSSEIAMKVYFLNGKRGTRNFVNQVP